MSSPSPAVRPSSTVAVSPTAAPSGRLATLAVAAVGASAIPLPLVPDRVVARLRGTVVHDVAARNGLSLTTDARAVLADIDAERGSRAIARKVAELLGRGLIGKALGPLGALATVARGVEVYALGHLFDRYLKKVRNGSAVRIHAEEARRVRDAIDRSLLRALAPTLKPASFTLPDLPEDLRDEFTRWIDTAILTGASLPSYVERRLEAAFDEVVAQMPGIRDA
jgi:hypothetical protein